MHHTWGLHVLSPAHTVVRIREHESVCDVVWLDDRNGRYGRPHRLKVVHTPAGCLLARPALPAGLRNYLNFQIFEVEKVYI
jgi:hypothetical protein